MRFNPTASDQATYEAGHPCIARDQSNLAMVLGDLGELGEARDLLEKALPSFKEKLDSQHSYCRIAQGNIDSLPTISK